MNDNKLLLLDEKDTIISKWEDILEIVLQYKNVQINIPLIRTELKKVTDYLIYESKRIG